MKAILLVAFLSLTQPAIPCWLIRSYVDLYGEARAVEWAKHHGYSLSQIRDIKQRCGIR